MTDYKNRNWAFNNTADFIDCKNCPHETHHTFRPPIPTTGGTTCDKTSCDARMTDYKNRNWAFNNTADFIDCKNCPHETHHTFRP
jgi:hypothetical protein